jgi:hypothetical protein
MPPLKSLQDLFNHVKKGIKGYMNEIGQGELYQKIVDAFEKPSGDEG